MSHRLSLYLVSFGLNLCQVKSGVISFLVDGSEKKNWFEFVSSQIWCFFHGVGGGGSVNGHTHPTVQNTRAPQISHPACWAARLINNTSADL